MLIWFASLPKEGVGSLLFLSQVTTGPSLSWLLISTLRSPLECHHLVTLNYSNSVALVIVLRRKGSYVRRDHGILWERGMRGIEELLLFCFEASFCSLLWSELCFLMIPLCLNCPYVRIKTLHVLLHVFIWGSLRCQTFLPLSVPLYLQFVEVTPYVALHCLETLLLWVKWTYLSFYDAIVSLSLDPSEEESRRKR